MRLNIFVFRLVCACLVFLPQILQAQFTEDSLLLQHQSTVYFDFGKANLPTEKDSLLAPIVDLYQQGISLLIDISAHTDAIGSDEANRKLSMRRADSVRVYLESKGVNDSLLNITTHGERQPIAENNTEDGRQLNRRATIQAFQKLQTTLISGKVRDKDSQEGIRADIVIHGKLYRDSFSTDSTGAWQRRVPANTVLGVDVFAPGHFYETEMVKTTLGKNKLIEVSIPLLKPGMSIPIKHIYFYGNSDRFLPRSKPELPKLLKFMLYNDTMEIEIAGHVNVPNKPPGFESKQEFNLSVNRAKAVYKYLVENNIRSSRLTFKGYGNSQMRFPKNPSLKQQEMNRRVEVKILGGKTISEEEF